MVSAEWQEWLASNLQRGCDVGVLVKKVVEGCKVGEGEVQHLVNQLRGVSQTVRLVECPGASVRFPQLEGGVFDGVFDPVECRGLIGCGRERLGRSTVVGQGDLVDSRRTSMGAWFDRSENALVAKIEARCSSIAGVAINKAEKLQILRYGVGQEYQCHFDAFLPGVAGTSEALKVAGQRIRTVLVYLNEPAGGGETSFPEAGIVVSPLIGRVVTWANVDSGGEVLPGSLHAGLAVREGEKWVAVLWFREREFPLGC